MDGFPLPVFNIESEDEEEQPQQPEVEVQEVKNPKIEHLHKLLAERSLSSQSSSHNAIVRKLEEVAEDNLLKKDLKESSCLLPGNPRSTFLMVFSPDGSKVASSHGDHNINVTDLRTNKCISTLSGHPRTPWCIAFHPHHNDILASGCLGGQVRVWDLHGGSEMWSVTASEVTTVIASLAFHPSERLLVIATNSTLYFWDWNIPQPFAKCSTANEKQKLRYVSFDPLGNWLLTGISNAPGSSAYFPSTGASTVSAPTSAAAAGAAQNPMGVQGIYRMERNEQERERNLQSRYQTLLDQYERLRVRYQELRHRAAELEHNANSSGTSRAFPEALVDPVQPPPAPLPSTSSRSNSSSTSSSAAIDQSALNGSSSDRFWRTLMNAAENLRALSNIGRSLNNPAPGTSGASSSSRPSGPALDQDARMRIQLLSRHIENMQRICRSHLEMTRHRRQVYRLQQIRRILEDLREQIRYLQVCVRDSLDRLRTTPTSPDTSGPHGSQRGVQSGALERPSQSPGAGTSGTTGTGGLDLLQFNINGRMVLGSRGYSPIQCRRFAHYLVGRLRRIGLQQQREYPRLRRASFRETRSSVRRISLRSNDSTSPTNPVEQIDPQPGPSRDYTMEVDGDDTEEEPSLERGSLSWRRSRFARLTRRSPISNRGNCLLHSVCHNIQRRKQPSILNRTIHGRSLQSHLRSVVSHLPPPLILSPAAPTPVPEPAVQRSDEQSLRPLMERLESHFRLQRQTMGILAQLNEAAGTATTPNSSAVPGPSSASAAAGSSETDAQPPTSSSSSRPWNHSVFVNMRQWRARRESLERAHSLDSRSTGTSDRGFQVPASRRMDSSLNFGLAPRYRSFRPTEDDDSSDTDTDLTAENTATNRWRQSSPIRSPRGVEQRMRLLWREYLSQVVHAQSNIGENSQQPADADAGADQERTRYRLWLSTMVESLTSFFSQHGINSAETESSTLPSMAAAAAAAAAPRSSALSSPAFPTDRRFVSQAMREAMLEDLPAPPVLGRANPDNTPWRMFPRVGIVLGGSGVGGAGGGGLAAAVGGPEVGPGHQRWNLRRNAESQVSLSAHLTYRIQAWDFKCTRDGFIPDIRDPQANVVVPESKIHNDASVDVSADGRFLVTLVPCTSLTGALISLHSLEPSSLGQCLAQVNVDQFVVSVSISPTCRHLLLGLASSRALSVASRDHMMPTLWAQVYQIPTKVFQFNQMTRSINSNNGSTAGTAPDPIAAGVNPAEVTLTTKKSSNSLQGILVHVRDLSQTTDVGMTSLNCIRWIPTAGQGFVLGTNKGHLKVIH